MKLKFDYSKLDFNKPITRKDIDYEIYNNKFKFVDAYNANPVANEADFLKIWEDKTMFSYQFLKLDGHPIKLYPYQDLVLNDPYRFKYFEAANQIGKSISLDVNDAYNFVHDHGKGFNGAIVSKSLPQATHQMRRIKSLLDSANFKWNDAKGSTDNMSVISLNITDDKGGLLYTNYLIVAPCSEALLGYDLHDEALDEFEFWENDTKYFYEQIAEPRTYFTNGDISIFTNPNGNDSYGAELTRIKLPDGSNKFHIYNFDFMDMPCHTQNDLDFASAGKSRTVVESTLLAIRSISSKNFFTTAEIDKSYDSTLTELDLINKQPFAFLDVGAKHDTSVLAIGYIEEDTERKDVHGNPFLHFKIPIIHSYPVGYPIARVVGHNVDVDDGWHTEKSVMEHLQEFKDAGIEPVFGVDVTGNSGISPLFNTAGINPIDVTFSGPVKSGLYQRFKFLMEKGLLHRIKCKEFEYQCSHLEMKKSARGYLMVHHENENDLDDVPDAIAGFIKLAYDPDYVEPTFMVI